MSKTNRIINPISLENIYFLLFIFLSFFRFFRFRSPFTFATVRSYLDEWVCVWVEVSRFNCENVVFSSGSAQCIANVCEQTQRRWAKNKIVYFIVRRSRSDSIACALCMHGVNNTNEYRSAFHQVCATVNGGSCGRWGVLPTYLRYLPAKSICLKSLDLCCTEAHVSFSAIRSFVCIFCLC